MDKQVIGVTDFKSEVKVDLQGCLEVVMHCLYPYYTPVYRAIALLLSGSAVPVGHGDIHFGTRSASLMRALLAQAKPEMGTDYDLQIKDHGLDHWLVSRRDLDHDLDQSFFHLGSQIMIQITDNKLEKIQITIQINQLFNCGLRL